MFAELEEKGRQARVAARRLAILDTTLKNAALRAMSETLLERQAEILQANQEDVASGRASGLDEAMLDRLLLTPTRLESIASDVLSVVGLPDPVGEIFDGSRLANGLEIYKRRVPIGVIGVIYESRPNVTVDISALCLKSGNAAILRGGKEAARSNKALAEAVAEGCRRAGVPEGAIQLIESQDRTLVRDLLRANTHIDMIIPRGGAALHQFALENATIPVISGGIGVCHIFIDSSADADKAVAIVHNAKVQRPTVCNALDTLLIHQEIAPSLLPRIADDLAAAGVEIRCEEEAYEILRKHRAVRRAGPEDFGTEFLSLILSVKVVDGLEAALEQIDRYSTHHSDAILTENYNHAMRFVSEVDSAAVYVNASTRFTDGSQFGLGAEVAISTQRLHARGPMGLRELTTYKWVVFGRGQIRGG